MIRICRGGCCSKVWVLGSFFRVDLVEKCLLLLDFLLSVEGVFFLGGKFFLILDKICLICMILCLKVGYDLLLSLCKCCFVIVILDDREVRVEVSIFVVVCGGIFFLKLMVFDKFAVLREEFCAVELLFIRFIFVLLLVE